jgi:hypothetical protein
MEKSGKISNKIQKVLDNFIKSLYNPLVNKKDKIMNNYEIKIGDKIGIKSRWDGRCRMEVLETRENELKVKVEFGNDRDAYWVDKEEVVGVLPKFDFFPYVYRPFEEKTGRAYLSLGCGERAMSNLRHEFAKEIYNPKTDFMCKVWGKKGIAAIKENGKDGLFNFFRDFAKFVVENIEKDEEVIALKNHNIRHVNGYTEETFKKELKMEIINNVKRSFEWDSCDTYEVFGVMKRAYGDWDEFFTILTEAFENYINENI